MAQVSPFRGLRFNPAVVGNVAPSTSPPYDVITPAERQELAGRSAYNMVRLILPEPAVPGGDRYAAAATTWSEWRAQGVFEEDAEPGFYVALQEYLWEGERFARRGLIAAVMLEPFENGVILPHEETFPGHKADRLKLMQACPVNFDCVFALYEEADDAVRRILDTAQGREPALAISGDGEHHTLWRITAPPEVAAIQEALRDRQLVIADGHHRYETALAYRDQRRRERGPGPWDQVMMTLCDTRDPGLLVLPTHRMLNLEGGVVAQLLKAADPVPPPAPPPALGRPASAGAASPAPGNAAGPLDLAAALVPPNPAARPVTEAAALRLRQEALHLGLDEHTPPTVPDILAALLARAVQPEMDSEPCPGLPRLTNRLAEAGAAGRRAYGVYCGAGTGLLLVPRDPGGPGRCQDVMVLQNQILPRMASYLEATQSQVSFSRSTGEAVCQVDSGSVTLAFLLNPIPVEEIFTVVRSGVRMPEKSTFFYPKLRTGLVLRSLESGNAPG